MSNELHRGTGMLLIEAVNSNPNGNPDQDSDPRRRNDGHGEISPVSFKHKIRELISDKEGPVWQEISSDLGITEDEFDHYDILEQKSTDRKEVKKLSAQEFLDKYWDARVFGSTFLEGKEQNSTFIHTGVVQFGLGISLSPIEIERLTTTKVMPAQEGRDKGMAPLAYRIVPYGLYAMPFFVNATMARRTHCTWLDIQILFRVLPYAYQETASYIRAQVNIRHAFYVEHRKARGCFNDFEIIEALTPNAYEKEKPAHNIRDYDMEQMKKCIEDLNKKMEGKAGPVVDLMEMI